ncbi:hypothetical protein CNMCM7691_005139 [Aspergillus felis]|uniref:Uncharacterized protein n=1 Tax=Aspergillus felis TaxID=1287682 RepID=A0A8H6QQG4_9EURO|nr:hypothetical protein CNMCM7691_005139 [Aspergillus felis]
MVRPITIIFVSLAIAAVLAVWGVFAWNGGFEELDVIVNRHPSTRIPGFGRFPRLDRGLMSMAAFNLPVVGRESLFSGGRHFMAQFLANVFAIPIVLLTEDFRAEPGSLARYSTSWGLFSQLATSAIMCPLYGVCFARQSDPGRIAALPGHSTWVVLISVLIGYGAPAVLIFDPFQWGLEPQIWGVLAFTFYPLYVCLTASMLKTINSKRGRSSRSMRMDPKSNLQYVVAGTVGVVGHLSYICINLGEHTGTAAARPERVAQLVLKFLQIDYVLTFAAILTLAWHELTHCRILLHPWRVAGYLILGWLFIGPGATLAAAWALRERWICQATQGKRKH